MKSKAIVPLVVGLLLFAGWVLAQASMTIQPLGAFTGEQQKSKTEPTPIPTPWPGAKLEDPIAQLKALLEPVGVRVTESKLINVYDVRKYRSLLIDWKSYKDAPDVVEYDSKKFAHIKELKLTNSSTHDGTLQTLHIATISNDEIFVIGVNADSELLWWTRIPDPRVLRSERPDAQGNFQGKVWHRSKTEIRIDAPDNSDISELRFYLPVDTTTGLNLDPLYVVTINEDKEEKK
jgi:hypothetical protein